MNKDDEKVLVIPSSELDRIGRFQGFTPQLRHKELLMLEPRFVRRGDCETDPSLKQIIPYQVVIREELGVNPLVFQRTKKSGEGRLIGKSSIGIGGHINDGDYEPGADGLCSFHDAAERELLEELDCEDDDILHSDIIGFLNDDSDPVGEVHLGVVMVTILGCPTAPETKDDNIELLGYRTMQSLIHPNLKDKLENWSKILVSSGKFWSRLAESHFECLTVEGSND